jgi:hypothetical protein
MNASSAGCRPVGGFRLRFESLMDAGHGLEFPCDPNGWVDMDGLSERGRTNYLFARAVVGREFAMPRVVPAGDLARSPDARTCC